MVSLHNPFRSPAAVTPTPSGASSPSTSPSTSRTTTTRTTGSPVGIHDRNPTESQQQAATSSSSPLERSVNDLLTEELPPAYTPAPNVYEGEATIELGPRRPFQEPTPVPRQNQPPWVSPQSTAASAWSSFPGDLHRESSHIHTRPAPPPTHPSRQPERPRSTPPHSLSDFARDFYSAGADGDADILGGPSSQYQGGTSSPSGTRYAPPPGEPPNFSTSPRSPRREQIPDDGRPTEKPVPGHPLLRHGKVLVYPKDYECQKCRNTGYKNFDPSHPCSRCWDKYAKPYAGPMTYAPWSADGQVAIPSGSRTNFQRPLPQFRAPQATLHHLGATHAGFSPSPPNLSRSATTSRVGSGYPGASARVLPVAGGGVPMSPYLDPLQGRGHSAFPPSSWHTPPPVIPVQRVPPPSGNVVVYPPGDPRIGGRLCWRCGGSGKTSFLIFDEETCGICNGIGRTFA